MKGLAENTARVRFDSGMRVKTPLEVELHHDPESPCEACIHGNWKVEVQTLPFSTSQENDGKGLPNLKSALAIGHSIRQVGRMCV